MDRLLDAFPSMLYDAMNEKLHARFTEAEIIAAVKQFYPTKALGPDGFPAVFYQR